MATIKEEFRGTWVAQSTKHPTLDFRSGHDLMICEIEASVVLSADNVEPAWVCLSPSLSAPPLYAHMFSPVLSNK